MNIMMTGGIARHGRGMGERLVQHKPYLPPRPPPTENPIRGRVIRHLELSKLPWKILTQKSLPERRCRTFPPGEIIISSNFGSSYGHLVRFPSPLSTLYTLLSSLYPLVSSL